MLNYFGQGAYAIAHPLDPANPFFAIAPAGVVRLALIMLSIIAAVIASQALISGTFSLTRQAIQLGYFPRLTVRHTNPDLRGQIFFPWSTRRSRSVPSPWCSASIRARISRAPMGSR